MMMTDVLEPVAVSFGVPQVETFFDPATNTATYLLSDPVSGAAAIIDPVLDYEPKGAVLSHRRARALLAAVRARGLRLLYVLETHAHADHLSSGDWLRRETGAELVIGAGIRAVQKVFAPRFEADDVTADGAEFDVLMADGDALALGTLEIRALHTPGHTPACVTYLVGDAAFVGDTLFMPDYGTARADFPGGDARTLYRSIQRILALPEATRVFVGHDYLPQGRDHYRFETSVAEQRARNIHVGGGAGEAEFVAMREARDATLAPPVLILPSLQVNIRGGRLPAPSPRGQLFLKLPVTVEA
jgi:glyoxylase-like metal-dependent hydrolase (beta-lactamase superfamily II)